MSVVIRCPACRGASRVAVDALGLTVGCPRCHEHFLAVEEATPIAPPAGSGPRSRPAPRPAPSAPPPDRPTAEPRGWAEPVAPPSDHHEGAPPASRSGRRRGRSGNGDKATAPLGGGLPISVMIGFALLPFAIPLLWLIAPLVVKQPPMLSLAAPIALAVAASVLCFAVVYTVDWTPATRIKGVLMLVGLAYFTGLSLYFLKQDMVERVRGFFGPESKLEVFSPPSRAYRVKMPRDVTATDVQPLRGWSLACYRGSLRSFNREFVFIVGAGRDTRPEQPNGEWFDAIAAALQKPIRDRGTVPAIQDCQGHEWETTIPQRPVLTLRITRIYRAKGTVYYLCIEAPNLSDDDDIVHTFFESFLANPPKE